ncbi:Leucine Rich Repeat family protein [Trichomonas vaginalis G3]|uniref:Leucine Rich Repeat family protein n=1 Tax=Trichomonas vaginalis (strain ATCC PRA-98 / G3) TaxID=412133 RepID=A2G2A4_TRIV3|nr:uncharacterized protein TVAGG3_0555080 [Trichomonas vaginalis G3]EAX88713.1 Leucine Rich Repeat family protein [Trichomonas vaginalis G3]KAI5520795.1 leucine-rich repeat, isoform f-related family [Trichomonas vaginalis G3]|eukprot:XP_001301643.1 hypothetical protein [Trichomonas vaginalis G3]
MDVSSVELAVQIAQKKGHQPVYSTEIRDGVILKEKQILIVSTRGLEIFNKEKDKVKWTKSIPWISVRKVGFKTKKVLLYLDKDVLATKIYSRNPKQLFGAICHALLQTQTIKELRTSGVSKYNFGNQPQSGIGIMSRLQQLLKLRKRKLNYINVQQFRQMLIFNESTLDFGEFPNPEHIIQLALDVLPLCHNFKSIIFPYIEEFSNFQLYTDYIPHLKYAEFLEFNCKKCDKLKQFLDEFSKKKNVISGISIVDQELPNSSLVALSNFIGTKKLTTLGLHTTFSAATFDLISEKFFTPQVSESLVSLDLSNTQGLSLSSLVPRLPKLLNLNLSNCGLQVDEILTILNNWSSMSGMRVLDVSGNACSSLFAKQFPSSLTKLIANNVSWGNGCLAQLIRILSTRTAYGIDVSLSRAMTDSEDFDLAFQEMENSLFTGILTFIWDENPVDARLFDFLLRSSDLKAVSFGGCFTSLDQNELQMFCEYLQLASSLQKVSLVGTEQRYIGEYASNVIRSCNKNVKVLDISNNRIGKSVYSVIKNLFITNTSNLEVIDFDGSYPENSQDLIDLLETAKSSQSKLTISFPVNDFNFLINKGKMETEVCDKCLSLFKKPPSFKDYDQNDSDFPVPNHSPFFDPFYVFRLEKNNGFPLFISREESELMKRTPPELFVKKNSTNKHVTRLVTKPMLSFKPSPQKNQHLSMSMLIESSEEESDSFNTADLQIKFSINDIMPNLKREDPNQKKPNSKLIKKRVENKNLSVETKNSIDEPKSDKNEPTLPKPPSPKSPKFVKDQKNDEEENLTLSRRVKLVQSTDLINQMSEYGSRIPTHASQYSSRIPLSSSSKRFVNSTPVYKTVKYSEDSEEEDEDDDSEGMATNKTTNTARIPFEGTYEYYSDDSFEEEEEEDFFSTPSYSDESQTQEEDEKPTVTNTQTKESRFSESDISGDYSYSYSDDYKSYSTTKSELKSEVKSDIRNGTNSPKFVDKKIDLPPPLPPSGYLRPVVVSRFDEQPKKTDERPMPFTPQNTVTEDGTNTNQRRVRPQRGIQQNDKTFGSRIRNSKISNENSALSSRINNSTFGSRVRKSNLNEENNEKPQSKLYGSRLKQNSIYGSRVKPPPAPVVKNVSETGEYTYSLSDYSSVQRPPPLPSPKSTTVVTSTLGSPPVIKMRNFK